MEKSKTQFAIVYAHYVSACCPGLFVNKYLMWCQILRVDYRSWDVRKFACRVFIY